MKNRWKYIVALIVLAGSLMIGNAPAMERKVAQASCYESSLMYLESVERFGKSKKSVTISKSKKTLKEGETFKLQLKKKKKALSVKWKSTKKKVAKVNKKGVVTAVKKGKATIYATYKGKKYKCVVTVKKKEAKPTGSNLSLSISLMDAMKVEGNELFSPVSLNLALGMVANSTEGNIRQDLENYLGCGVTAYNQRAANFMAATRKQMLFL